MKVPISSRLRACCEFVSAGDRVADVGTDHGYLGIWLLLEGKARSVIASDIVPGPLSAAKRNAARFGVADRMTFCLSDGVQSLPRDFDTLVCAGMGGDTMISILSAGQWLQSERYRLVLQCQSKTADLRRYLSENGWRIAKETVLRDGRFLYTIMEVLWDPECVKLTPGQWHFSPALLQDPAPALPEYYEWVLRGLRISAAHKNEPGLDGIIAELEALGGNPALAGLKEETK